MKKQFLTILLLLGTAGIACSTTTGTNIVSIKEEVKPASILNYDSSLGIYRDLTSEEVKSYYTSGNLETGLTGEAFLSRMQSILKKNQKKISHDEAWTTTWNYFTLLDRDYALDPLSQTEINNQKWKTDNLKIIPLYTDKTTFLKSNKHIDREHIWPKSRGFKYSTKSNTDASEQPYAATDMHNLRMGESNNNQNGHNNYPYGEVVNKNASDTKALSSLYTNEVTGYQGKNENGVIVYEPRDEDKGDIARALFYMATRYHNFTSVENYDPSLKLVDFKSSDPYKTTIPVDETKTSPATYGVLSTLLKWHKADPVSEYEVHRNNLVFNAVQYNRNPYIDYPDFADVAFGSKVCVDLNNANGVKEINNSLTVSLDKKEYKTGETLRFLSLKVTLNKDDGTNETIQNYDTRLKLTLIHNGTETKFDSNYTFTEEGNYILRVEFNDGSLSFSEDININVTKKEEEPAPTPDPEPGEDTPDTPECNHVDADEDEICDICGATLPHKMTPEEQFIAWMKSHPKEVIFIGVATVAAIVVIIVIVALLVKHHKLKKHKK